MTTSIYQDGPGGVVWLLIAFDVMNWIDYGPSLRGTLVFNQLASDF